MECKMKIDIHKNYSVEEASRVTGMSVSWFRQMISKQEIEYLKIGGRVFIMGGTIKSLILNGIRTPE